jgi:glycosyltransferase involved in cell wall biosynthesis
LSALWFQTFLEGLVVPRFDGVICITNYTRRAIEHAVSRTWVVPNAVDPEFLSLGEKRINMRLEVKSQHIKSYDENPIILVVASIDSRKNQNAFIKSLDSLVGVIPFEVRFFGKCGDDDYGGEFQSLIKSRSWCYHGGMIGREELRKEFGGATLLVLPTHEDNCPMVVLEAMAAGLPVMASNVGGVPDLIDGSSTGLFCDPHEPESFRVGVRRVLEDREFTHRMASAAHEDAVKRFHPKIIAKKHLEIYQELLKTFS